MKSITRISAALLALAVSAGLSGEPLRAQEAAPVRIAASPVDNGSEPFYAADMGFFAKAGLNAAVQMVQNSNVIINGLIGGSLDIGFVLITSLEGAYAKGLPLVAIAPASYFDSSKGRVAYLMVRNGAAINDAKDFEGKVVADFPLKSVGELSLSLWIDKSGGDSSKVKYLEVPFPAMAAALQQGRVDAAIMIEPFATAAKSAAHVVGPDPAAVVAPVWLTGVFVTTKAYAAAHPDVVRRFAAAMRETADWANKNQAKSAIILSKYNSIDVSVINASPRALFADQLRPAWIAPTIDVMARYKLIDAPFKADELIYHPAP